MITAMMSEGEKMAELHLNIELARADVCCASVSAFILLSD